MPIQIPSSIERTTTPVGQEWKWTTVTALLRKDIVILRKGFSDVRRERLFRELNLLLHAGVDPRSVLELLWKTQPDEGTRRIVGQVRDGVMRGSLLSTAMEQAGSFTPHEVYSIRIGEESGRLADVSLQLAEHYADRLKLRRMVRQAFAYPLFILVITLGVVLFMMNVVVPMFAQVFARSGAELPALTRHVLSASDFIRTAWPFLLLAAAGLVFAFLLVRKQRAWRIWSERIGLRVPVLGPLRRKALMARYSRTMAFLLGSGAPLDRALELSERMAGSPKLERALADIRNEVVKGRPLHEAMRAHDLFDAQMVTMVAVAEEVKQLDAMHLRISERYAADVQHRTAMLGSVLEPATILVIAVLVGTVLVAMYLPMFKLSTAF